MNRRHFLKSSAAASVVYSSLPFYSAIRNTQKVRIALIGCGWWGMNILREAIAAQGIKVVGLCDVDRSARDKTAAEVKSLNGDTPKLYNDYREMLQREKPQIVIVATPDHWHALTAIAAIKQGADVYIEKPISHTVYEGLAIVQAARKHGRIVQVGTHRRISPHNISGMEFLRSGKVGKISQVSCFVNYGGGPGEKVPDQETPEGLDWDLWCGPAPLSAFNPKIHPKGFRQFMDYANGTIGDWGIHWFDQVLWWTEEKYPKSVYATGGRFVKQDNTDAPDTLVANFEFESFTLNWENRLCAPNTTSQSNIGCYFYGTEGTFHMGWRDGWTFYPRKEGETPIHVEPQLNQPDGQNIRELWADFLACIESRQHPVCDIEIGYRSTNVSLLAVMSYKLGRSIRWDGEKNQVIGDPEAGKLLRREYRGDWEYPAT